MKFGKLSEQQIRKAQAEGQLDDLKGAGKPLPAKGDGDFAEAAGFRIMAEAGALPREIELKKAIQTQAQKIQSLTDPAEKRQRWAFFRSYNKSCRSKLKRGESFTPPVNLLVLPIPS